MTDVQDLKSRIEMLELAVEMLEERLSALMETEYLDPYPIELSEEDVQKIKDWVLDSPTNIPDRFKDISNGE